VSVRAKTAGLWIGWIGEIILGVAAFLWGCVAILGSMAGDTADLSLGGALFAVFAVPLAAAGRRQGWKWHAAVLALLAVSAILSLLDIASARNWFD
jgi:hypothetical protein